MRCLVCKSDKIVPSFDDGLQVGWECDDCRSDEVDEDDLSDAEIEAIIKRVPSIKFDCGNCKPTDEDVREWQGRY